MSGQNSKPGEARPPTVIGYQASNTVALTLKNMDAVGEIIDAAVEAGANRINNV